MTKVFIISAGICAMILLAGLVLNAISPTKISIETQQSIQASPAEVFDQLRFMKNFPSWSPFLVQDPMQKFTIGGTDGQIGATYHWEGVGEKSRGFQTITFLKDEEEVRIDCEILEPFQASPTFSYNIQADGAYTRVVQHFELPLQFPANVFGLLLNLKEKMAQTNRLGMDLLKERTEDQKAALMGEASLDG